MKKELFFASIIGFLIIVGWGYWVSLGDAQHWLLFNEKLAEVYADSLLKGEASTALPDELIDVQISAHLNWVLFSPHAEGHSFILAYSPKKEPDLLNADGKIYHWRKLNNQWYELAGK